MQPSVHDSFFKSTFSQVEHAASVLRLVLPERIVERLDFATLSLCPGSFVDEVLKERQSDLLFSVSFAARPAFVYVLFEHQSTFDRWMSFRVLRYMLRIWESWQTGHPDALRLPLIIPVVLHHSESGWTGGTAFEDLLDIEPDELSAVAAHVPRFRFVLDDISHETDEALKARAATALARLALWCLRHAREPGELVERLGAWVDLVREVRRAPNGPAAIGVIWRYILAISEPGRAAELVRRLVAAVGTEGQEEIVTAAEQLIEEGRRDGERKVLLKQLRLRFGPLPDSVVARVAAAEPAQVDAWTERVLTAQTLGDVIDDA